MSRFACLGVLLYAVSMAIVGADLEPQGGYGLRYSQRQREARREMSEGFSPSPEVEEVQQENVAEAGNGRSRRQRQRVNSHDQQQVTSSSAADSSGDATGYRTVVVHSNSEDQRPNGHYQTQRKKPTKPRQKVRQIHREAPNYKPQIIKPSEPTPETPNVSPSTPSPRDPFVHAVHPSIMQNLLKQQPQTFDVPQEKETENYEHDSRNWHSQGTLQNNGQGLTSFHNDFSGQEGQQENHDGNKRPIYVPNRVSVQSPSSDTSFNVGYSIGFGNGLAQPPRLGIVQPPPNLRQGKQLTLPSSYHNTPVNVHVDGKNSVWKNMGSGVEMSHNMDTKIQNSDSSEGSDRNVYSSGSVVNQPIFFREDFDHNFNSISTSGRNNFDHNHALQQSNSFDFSNAIDPSTHHPYPSAERTNHFASGSQPSLSESFPKHPVHSFTESFPSHPHQSNSHLVKHSFAKGHPKFEAPNVSPKLTHTQQESNEEKYQHSKYEQPNFPTSSSGKVRTPIHIKHSLLDFPKSIPGLAKTSYSIKAFGNSNNAFNSINDETSVNNYGVQGAPALSPFYSSPSKVPPPGMVQAILVPVNSAHPSYSYPIGMPILGNGYSPYFGHPVGMVRIPESIGTNNPSKEDYENSPLNTHEDSREQSYQKSPMQFFQSHYTTMHHNKEEAQDPQPPLTRPNNSPSRFGDLPERSPKFQRVFTTESPEHASSPVKSHAPSLHIPFPSSFKDHSSFKDYSSFKDHSSFKDSSSLHASLKEPFSSHSSVKEISLPHYPAFSHHPRPYRTKQLVIVKRT